MRSFYSVFVHLSKTYDDPYNEEAITQYHRIDEYIEELKLVEAYYRGGDYRAAVELATALLEVSPWSAQLRQLRAECYIALVIIYTPTHTFCYNPTYKHTRIHGRTRTFSFTHTHTHIHYLLLHSCIHTHTHTHINTYASP